MFARYLSEITFPKRASKVVTLKHFNDVFFKLIELLCFDIDIDIDNTDVISTTAAPFHSTKRGERDLLFE